MDDEKLLQKRILDELISTAEKLGIRVRREHLLETDDFVSRGGKCTLSGDNVIFVNSRLSALEQISILAESLAPLVHEDIFLLPRTRQVLEKHLPAGKKELLSKV